MSNPITNFILTLAGKSPDGFPALRKFTTVESKCPLLLVNDNYITRCKDGSEAIVIEISGQDYTGLDKSDLHTYFIERQAFFDQLPNNILCMCQSFRSKVKIDFFKAKYSNKTSSIIAQKWAENFDESFRTKHYIILTSAKGKGALALFESSVDKATGKYSDKIRETLDTVVSDALSRLKSYGPRILKGDDLASFWASSLNGRQVRQKLPSDGILDDLISDTRLFFPKGKNMVVYDGLVRKYSSFLCLKMPPDDTGYELLNGIFSIRRDIRLFQSFSTFEKSVALDEVEKRLRNERIYQKDSDISVAQLEILKQRIQADEFSLTEHRFALEIFGDSEEDLKAAILDIRSLMESLQYRIFIETVNVEALFWSRFPSMDTYNARCRNITTENASHYSTFPTVGEGSPKCSFGPYPVNVFKTDKGSDYSFIPHISESPKALGHVLIIGQPGSGKTVLASFLLSCCTKYPGFRGLSFDMLDGMEIFTRSHDGIVITTDDIKNLKLNPFQLDNNETTKLFLTGWLAGDLIKTKSELEKDQIADAVSEIFTLPRKDRNLTNFAPILGLNEEGSLRQRLEKWLPGGSYGSYFSAEEDALNLDNPFLTFSMTSLVEREEVLAPFTSYIFHRINTTAFPGGFMFFLDEAPAYANNEIILPHIDKAILQWRKKNGVFMFASQNAEMVYESKMRKAVKSGVGTYILFPDSKAEYEIYQDCFGLTRQEFDWIKGAHPRQCMIKRKSGNSIIINVDLSCLGKHLKFFDSSEDQVKRVRNLMEVHGNDWKEIYLNS